MKAELIQLDGSQETALRRLHARLGQQFEQLKRLGSLSDEETRQASISRRRFDYSNIFGILGPRGAGKSTMAYALPHFEDEQTSCCLEDDLVRSNPHQNLVFLHPLDCSTVPQGIEPGLAILIHIRRALYSWMKAAPTGKKDRLEKVFRKLSFELLPTYIRLNPQHKDLRLDFASSPNRFAENLVEDIDCRLSLSDQIADVLSDLAKVACFDALVLPLDDFDLVHNTHVRQWLQAMLDELHQPRLFLIVTADYYRLQHLAWDPEPHFDDKTGRQLLNKLLPWQNRVTLSPWRRESRLTFIRLMSVQAESEAQGLEEIIRDLISLPPVFSALTLELLPQWPRGLAHLYEAFGTRDRFPFEEFLVLLASARGESLFARALEEHRLLEWEELLSFRDGDLSSEAWEETVRAACERGLEETPRLRPLRSLRLPSWPYRRLSDIETPSISPPKRESSEGHKTSKGIQPAYILIDHVRSEPDSHDPLRHQELWERSLRDAEDDSHPYWIELLLTASFSTDLTENIDVAMKNRVSFLKRWHPTRSRSDSSNFRILFQRSKIEHLFEDYEEISIRPLLYWMHLNASEHGAGQDVALDIGWQVLLASLRLDHDPLELGQISSLGFNIRRLRGDIPSSEPQYALGLVPETLWAILLLIDGLDRCPWSAFSSRLGWSVPTYLLLCGALVHGAYLHAMKKAEALDLQVLRSDQRALVHALAARDPAFLLKGRPDANGRYDEKESYEENVFARLRRIVDADLPSGDDPLGKAAKHFQELAPYQALRELAAEGLLL